MAPFTIASVALAPILVAPASTILRTSSYVLMPPEAFTCTLPSTWPFIICTSSIFAEDVPKPVDVFTKSTPVSDATTVQRAISSAVR